MRVRNGMRARVRRARTSSASAMSAKSAPAARSLAAGRCAPPIWPAGLAGRDIEAVGRVPLWAAGQNFDHGLGHGVGAYLSVHEGPQRISKPGGAFPGTETPLREGMILSNEPGYYKPGEFGIPFQVALTFTKP